MLMVSAETGKSGIGEMPESQRTQSLRDGLADFRVFDQTLARVQGILQKSFRNPVAGMSA
jgi:hypothetical protein